MWTYVVSMKKKEKTDREEGCRICRFARTGKRRMIALKREGLDPSLIEATFFECRDKNLCVS